MGADCGAAILVYAGTAAGPPRGMFAVQITPKGAIYNLYSVCTNLEPVGSEKGINIEGMFIED